MKFIVVGIDGKTGVPIRLHLDARDIEDAKAVAYRDGDIADQVLRVRRGSVAVGGKAAGRAAFSIAHVVVQIIVGAVGVLVLVGGILGVFGGLGDSQLGLTLIGLVAIVVGWLLLVKACRGQNP